MPSFALGIEYDGSDYHGWQSQEELATIQGKLEQALSTIADAPIKVICAGRTDRGVHAVGQVVNFSTEIARPERAWLFGGNRYLPTDIGIQWVKPVPDTFSARFDALSRRYQYIIYNHTVRNALYATRMTWQCRPLNVEAMHIAAQFLVGEHDFQSYRAQSCQAKSSIREIYEISVQRRDNLVIIDIHANAFLHHMVRNITGVLMRIGVNEQPPVWAKEVLLAKDRTIADVTAPPHGLYLMRVTYPEHYQFPISKGIITP